MRGVFFFVVLVKSLSGQTTIEFDRYTIDDGLSMNTVNAIVQDRDGFLWLGTSNGLNRFNGYDFTIYNSDPVEKNVIPNPRIQALAVDRSGRLWIGTFGGGLCKLDPDIQRFRTFDDSTHREQRLYIQSLSVSTDDSVVYVGTNGSGGFSLDVRTGTFQRKSESATATLYSIWVDDRGHEWVGTDDGLVVRRANRVSTYHPNGSQKVFAIYQDSFGRMWIGTDRGLIQWKEDHMERVYSAKQGYLSDDRVYAMAEADGGLWIGTENGLNHLDFKTDRVSRFFHNPHHSRSLPHNVILTLFKDRQGSVWGGTYGGGAFRIHTGKSVFLHLHVDPASPLGIARNDVYSLLADRHGYLWIGSDGGLDILHPVHRSRLADPMLAFGGPSKIPRSFWEDDDIWIGTLGSGLYRYSRAARRIERVGSRADELGHEDVSVIRRSDDGRLWIGTLGGGVAVYNSSVRTWKRFVHDPANPASLSHNVIYSMHTDSSQRLWIGTGRGLDCLDLRSDSIRHYRHDPSDPTSLSNDVVEYVYETSSREIWVGTLYGLNRLNKDGRGFTRYFTSDGLPGNKIYGIVEDRRRRLWISTADGLGRVEWTEEDQTIRCRSFHREDGLQSDEFTQGLCQRMRDGRLVFGGVNGVTVFDPDRVPAECAASPVVLMAFKGLDRSVRLASSGNASSIELDYDENDIGFEFVCLDFHAPRRSHYFHRMEGFDKDWVEAGKRRFATYTNLDPGAYVFRVRAANHHGVWSQASLEVRIAPPFWVRWWFRAAVLAAVVTGVVLIYRFRVRQLVEIERVRTRIASDLHDEIGSTLTRIAMHSEIIQSADDREEMRRLAYDIGQHSRSLIRTMSDVVWSIDARHDTVGDLVDRLHDVAHHLFTLPQRNCHFNVRGLEPAQRLSVELRQNLYFIAKEAMVNIVKHSDATEVFLEMSNESELKLSIRDNGSVHTPKGYNLGGNGLRNMEMRAAKIGGKLETGFDRGFFVVLRCPPVRPMFMG